MSAEERFNRLADRTADAVAHAWFFAFCVASVAIWLPAFPWFKDLEAWQLPMNTYTTIVTFLLVALLHNDQHRFERATNARLEEVLEKLDGARDPVEDEGQKSA